jgi:hypothetical protein
MTVASVAGVRSIVGKVSVMPDAKVKVVLDYINYIWPIY